MIVIILLKIMELFDDIWYQIFHFLYLSDIYNVLQTNKQFSLIATHQVRISEEIIRKWHQSHQSFLKNSNVVQKNKILDKYNFSLDHERGLKLGFKHNKYRNSISFCILSYWGAMKRWKISFSQNRFISVHFSQLHKHSSHSSSNDIYHVHIFDYNDRRLIHFFEITIDLQFLTHIRVGFKFIENSTITSMGCKSDFQKRFSIHSSSFSYGASLFKIGYIILGSRYDSYYLRALFICTKGCFLFCAQTCKLYCLLKHDLKIDLDNIHFDSPNETTITITKGQNFNIYQKPSNQWKFIKSIKIQETKETTFQKYCPITDKILVF
jgi:hypothetical protein